MILGMAEGIIVCQALILPEHRRSVSVRTPPLLPCTTHLREYGKWCGTTLLRAGDGSGRRLRRLSDVSYRAARWRGAAGSGLVDQISSE